MRRRQLRAQLGSSAYWDEPARHWHQSASVCRIPLIPPPSSRPSDLSIGGWTQEEGLGGRPAIRNLSVMRTHDWARFLCTKVGGGGGEERRENKGKRNGKGKTANNDARRLGVDGSNCHGRATATAAIMGLDTRMGPLRECCYMCAREKDVCPPVGQWVNKGHYS